MLYYLVRPLAAIAIAVFYRKIQLSNTQNIPKNKPVILAVNHPTGFMEPCILACYLDRPLYFLVRGDFFKKSIYNFLMRSLHMIPIYRAQDRGYKFLKNNYDTFKFCYDALHSNKTIMILVEGSARFEKNLRPLKKGTPRIAFGALEHFPDLEDVFVVPVGVNYTYAEAPRTEVMIDFGEPLKVRDYLADFQENASTAAAEFNEALRKRMEERIIVVEKGDEALAEYLLRLHRSDRLNSIFPIIGKSKVDLNAEKQVSEQIREMSASQKTSILEKGKAYFRELEDYGITDKALVHPQFSGLIVTIILVLGFPFFLLGFVFNFLPVRLAKIIPDTKVKRTEFIAPVFWAVSLGASLLWSIIWIIFLLAIGKPLWILGLIGLICLGYFSILYLEFFQEKIRQYRAQKLDTAKRTELLAQRTILIRAFIDKSHSAT